MINLVCFRKKLEQWCHSLCFLQPCRDFVWSSIHVLVCRVNPFWIQLFYFIIISSLGYLALIMFDTRKPWPAAAASSSTSTNSNTPKDFDVFFTSVSAATVSSMSTVEMEVFSNSQLVILTILMLFGGEIFTSMLGLVFIRYSNNLTNTRIDSVNMDLLKLSLNNNHHHLSIMSIDSDNHSNLEDKIIEIYSSNLGTSTSTSDHNKLKYNSIKYLVYVVLGYHLMVHICGSSLVYMYFSIVSTSARQVLENKGIHRLTFSIFTIVSTISNCGFVPTNENMMVFKANSGLLWILIPQILVGNTLFPTCLRVVIWVLERITKRVEFSYMLNNTREMEYSHLLSTFYSTCLAFTVLGFVALQFILFCSMEWNNTEAMYGFNCNYHKLVASLFQVVNSRHTGESVVDLSIISPAILVLFVVMMYLPPYMSFVPTRTYMVEEEEEEEEEKDGKKERKKKPHPLVKCLIFSHLSYLVIFIFLICITERQNIKEDPLNFNVLNIVFEVISAYGNVGFSTGYSCERRIISDYCENKMYGFVGRWTNKGKLILIIVMFFGRLKKFNMKGGSSWKLL